MNAPFVFTIQTQKDLIEAVQSFGFLPLFRNSLPGFSVEEHVLPRAWFSAEPGVWEWKGPVIQKTRCAYGKFFEKKAAFVSAEWFPDLANVRRDGCDFDTLIDMGRAPHPDQVIMNAVMAHHAIDTKALKEMTGYDQEKKGFDTIMTRLQMETYLNIRTFVYPFDKHGEPYGWGIAEYTTPEQQFGQKRVTRAYSRTPEESRERIIRHLLKTVPGASEDQLNRLIG